MKLLLQVFFWGCFCYVLARSLGWVDYGFKELIYIEREIMTRRWFISAYLLVYLLAPVLNMFIERISLSDFEKYLLYFYGVSSILGWCMRSQEFNEGMSMISLLGIYLTGAYLKKTDRKIFHLPALQNFVVYLTIGVGLVITTLIARACGFMSSPIGYLNPFVCLEAIFLFLGFRELHVASNSIINWIASSSFAIYLFHCHPIITPKYALWGKWINQQCHFSLLVALVMMCFLFIGCVLVDKVFIVIFENMWRCWEKFSNMKN